MLKTGLATCLRDLPGGIGSRFEKYERRPVLPLCSVHGEIGVVNDFLRRCAIVGDQNGADGRADLV